MSGVVFFDLETQKLAAEVGGWGNAEAMRLSVACTFDEERGYQDWWEAQAAELIDTLRRAQLIVGFNVSRFDYRVLALYGNVRQLYERTFDMLDEMHGQGVQRVSLNHLAVLNLGEAKVYESGVQAVRLYRAGKLEELAAYCRRDVELTKRLYEQWESHGFLFVSAYQQVIWPGQHTDYGTDTRIGEEEAPQGPWGIGKN